MSLDDKLLSGLSELKRLPDGLTSVLGDRKLCPGNEGEKELIRPGEPGAAGMIPNGSKGGPRIELPILDS